MARWGGQAAYLPRVLVERLQSRGAPRALPHRDELAAGILVVDLADAIEDPSQPLASSDLPTSDTGRFARVGASEGVERISAALPPVFDAVRQYGGSVVTFGDGKLLALFPGDDGAARGLAAATAIERAPALAGGALEQRLHWGTVEALHLGTPGQAHYTVCGAAVAHALGLRSDARRGTVLLSREAAARARPAPATSGPALTPDDPGGVDAYLPPGIHAALHRADGAYRPVACLYLETRGCNPAALQQFYLSLHGALTRYEGALIKSHPSAHGTRWLCAFGLAVAHENDPERAARAALDLLGETGDAIALRGGVHAGVVASVAVGQLDRRFVEIVGEVLAVSSLAANCAEWGEVWLTESVRRSIPGVQALPRGDYGIPGRAGTVRLCSLFGQRAAARAVNVLAPLVGRDEEIAVLREALRDALEGRGTALGIQGVSGMGKSRLKHEMTLMAGPMGYAVHRAQASAVGGIAYGVVAQLLRGAMGIADNAERESLLERVRTECERLGLQPSHRHHLADMLGHRHHDSPLAQQNPKDIRTRNLHALAAYVARISRDQPRLLLVDDAHWVDDSSGEALRHLAAAAAATHAVLVLLYRPELQPTPDLATISLTELSNGDIARLTALLVGDAVSPAVERVVRERAQGNPFYAEEVVRHLMESRLIAVRRGRHDLVRELTPDDVPPSLEATIASRLDRLSPEAQQVAQVGAVLGRRFPRALLAGFDELAGVVEPALRELQSAHVLFETVDNDLPMLVFKHALTHDVVYSGILLRSRNRLHRAAATRIESLFAADRERYLPLLAHHYQRAGDRAAARACYVAAAQSAASRYAHGEAERLYRSYIDLVDQPTAESVSVLNFYASEVLHRRGDMKAAAAEHERALAEAQRIGDVTGQATALRGLGVVYWDTGHMRDAEAACERALALFRSAGDRRGQGKALMTLANVRGDQGHLDEARDMYSECLAIHREVGNVEAEGLTLSNLAEVHRLQGRLDVARDLYEEALEVTESANNRQSTGVVLSNLAVICHELGEIETARPIFERALAIHREVGSRAFEAYTRCELGRMLRRIGADLDEVERALQEAKEIADQAGTIDKALCLCEFGHIALARGAPARDYLRAAESLTPVSSVGADSEFGAAVVRLRRAVEAYERRIPLFRGERVDDLPDGLRQRLVADGHIPHLRA